MQDCIFCRILAGTLPATVVFQNQWWIVIKDINPQAPVHLLVIAKEHLDSFAALAQRQAEAFQQLPNTVREVAALSGVESYRLLTNVGSDAGQTVQHLHWHFLAGEVFNA